ncbi:MAG: hypothetical protein ACYTXY_05865, partial [Nostoc sp.]
KKFEEKSYQTFTVYLFSPPMKNDEYPPQSDAGGAEPLQNKDNYCGKSCGSGAEEVESGAGVLTEDEAATSATITSDTVLIEAESDNCYSVWQIEKDGGDVARFIGCQVEVRSHNSGIVKFIGKMIGYDEKNAIVKVVTEQGERDIDFREAFVFG